MMDAFQTAGLVAAWAGVGLLALAGVLVSCLGFTGAWLLALAAAAAVPLSGSSFPDWSVAAVFAATALAVDVVEWLASHWGVRRRGGSRLAGVAAMVGGFVGLILGGLIPVPILGNLAGMLAGSFALAYAVERSRLRAAQPAAYIAFGAVLAGLSVLLLKVAVALVLAVVLAAGILLA